MPLHGTLSTMPLPDLLQWLGTALKTGTLQIERNRATKTIRVREGRVIGCSSDEPAQRLGQFLLSRKKINEEQLRQALIIHEESPKYLGQTLVEMGALSAEELVVELKAKVEEIIYSLFDWNDSVFRFEETVTATDVFPVDIRMDDILLRGVQRFDEMEQIRGVFHDPGLVLRYTSKPPGPEIFGDETRRAMYSAIDGERTLADILLHVHGTEYRVKAFLFELHQMGYVEISGVKKVEEPMVVPEVPVAATAEPELDQVPLGPIDLPPVVPTTQQSGAAVASLPEVSTVQPGELSTDLARAGKLMADGRLEEALDTLDALYGENPGDDALRRLTAEAEAAFIEKAYQHYLPGDRVPILTRPIESLESESLTPQDFFVLSRIDGSWDIKSIIQVAPFREIEALRTLKRLKDLGMIELCDAS